jgi:uncharacterized protein (TIGR03086 family)
MDTSTLDQVSAATEAAYERVIDLSGSLDAEQRARPTDCGDWSVDDLLGHLAANTVQIGRIFEGEKPDWSAPAPPDPVTAMAECAHTNATARSQPGAADAEIMPGVLAADMNLIEVVGHTWDLAHALGTDVGLSDSTARTALEAYSRLPLDGMRGSSFGPVIVVPDNAPPIDRLAGLLGRQP